MTSVILENQDGVLLVRRAGRPLQGYWCLPGGYIRYVESPEMAAVREVKEETNLDIHLDRLVGIYLIDNDPGGVNLDIIWTGLSVGGTLKINEESIEARYFHRHEMPALIAYKH